MKIAVQLNRKNLQCIACRFQQSLVILLGVGLAPACLQTWPPATGAWTQWMSLTVVVAPCLSTFVDNMSVFKDPSLIRVLKGEHCCHVSNSRKFQLNHKQSWLVWWSWIPPIFVLIKFVKYPSKTGVTLELLMRF